MKTFWVMLIFSIGQSLACVTQQNEAKITHPAPSSLVVKTIVEDGDKNQTVSEPLPLKMLLPKAGPHHQGIRDDLKIAIDGGADITTTAISSVNPSVVNPFKGTISSFDTLNCGMSKYYHDDLAAINSKNNSSNHAGEEDPTSARQNEFPWLVRIEIGRNKRRWYQICEGVIISKNVVLTVRKCFTKLKSSSDVNVRLGDHQPAKMETGELVRGVSEILYRNNGNKNNVSAPEDDYAILILNEPVTFSNSIRPICLGRSCSDSCKISAAHVVGGWFGSTKQGVLKGNTSLVDTVANGNGTSSSNCGHEEDSSEIVTSNKNFTTCGQTTFGNPEILESNSCRNYIGSPVMCVKDMRYQLYGLALSSSRCGKAVTYGNICGAIDWIFFVVSVANNQLAADKPTEVGSVAARIY